jgi:hypothetical protein
MKKNAMNAKKKKGDGKSNKIITTKKSDCQFADSPTFFVYLSFETVPWGGARFGEGS